tara:strand:- start:145 stop:492 length:348 start_codon:yes stop_codon:yes gene_type:complete
MPKYRIEAKHTIYVTYEVEVAEGDDDNDAIARLESEGYTLHSYNSRNGKVFGFNIEHYPECIKVLPDTICWDQCPEPSGSPVIRRNWSVYEVGDENYERTNDAMDALSEDMNPVG